MSFRLVLLALGGIFVFFFSDVILRGQIIFPHDNAAEAGLSGDAASEGRSNRKFSDESSAFIPELANNLGHDRKSWLITWNPHVQLGRPAYQVSGLSRAYLVTNFLSLFTSNPFVLYTLLTLVIVGATTVFSLLFLRSRGLHPAAAGFATVGLTFTTFVSYWLTFVMFLSAICWSMCLLWLITKFTHKPSWLVALGISFATYSLLMTAYPQIAVLMAYLVGSYALVRLVGMRVVFSKKAWVAVGMMAAAGIGVLASVPVFLDLLLVARESTRLVAVEDSFFLAVLPPAQTLHDFGTLLATVFDWSWLGNAIDPSYPVTFNGFCFTPVYGTLIWFSCCLKEKRKMLFWQLSLVVCVAMTLIPGLYLFAVHHLGFGLSRLQVLIGGLIPGFVLCGYGAEAVLNGELDLTLRRAIWLFVPLLLELSVALLFWSRATTEVRAVIICVLLVIVLVVSIYWHSAAGFGVLALLSLALYGRPLILSRPPRSVHTSSALTKAIKAHTPDASRFAIADSSISLQLPPNEETLFNLYSINSYDSLSSRSYQELVLHWSEEGSNTYGRNFKFINADLALSESSFRLSNVRLILSARPLTITGLSLVGQADGVRLYEPITAPVSSLQTPCFQLLKGREATMDPLSNSADRPPRRLETLNDFQKFAVTPMPQETLLFLSQQYHRSWLASAQKKPLRTVIVDHFYQGVILPPDTREVELAFKPYVLWSWVPQAGFVVAAALLIFRAGCLRAW